MEDLTITRYWKIKNQLKKINDIMNVIKVFIDKKTIVTIEQLNTTIENTLKEEINNLKNIIE